MYHFYTCIMLLMYNVYVFTHTLLLCTWNFTLPYFMYSFEILLINITFHVLILCFEIHLYWYTSAANLLQLFCNISLYEKQWNSLLFVLSGGIVRLVSLFCCQKYSIKCPFPGLDMVVQAFNPSCLGDRAGRIVWGQTGQKAGQVREACDPSYWKA
jgi:hypothetical protein